MYKFIKELKQVGYLVPPTKILNSTYRVFNHILLKDDIKLSIQCSEQHYCTPRKTLNIEDYETYELAILKNDKFKNAKTVILDFKLLEEISQYQTTEGIYTYVPKFLVEKIYKYLITNYRYKF